MSNEPVIPLVGNLTADPELRFTPQGSAVVNFTVAATPRHYDRQANEWKDGETLFLRCSLWREYAENAAETLTKGMRVVVIGRLKSQSWTDKTTGEQRTGFAVDVDEVGPALRYATAQVVKSQRGQGQPQGQPQGWQPQGQPDPWATPQQAQQPPQQGYGSQTPTRTPAGPPNGPNHPGAQRPSFPGQQPGEPPF